MLIFGTISYSESSDAIRKKNGLFEAEVVKQLVRNIQTVMEKASADATPATDHVHSTQAIFAHIFDGVALGDGSADEEALVFVLDVNNGHILIRPPGLGAADRIDTGDGSAAPAAAMADPGLLSGIGRIVGSGGGPNFVSYTGADGRDYLAAFAPVPDTSWAAVSAMPLQALTGEVRALRNKIMLMGLICVAFVLLASYAICRSISVPLRKLVCMMKQTEDGNYRVQLRSGESGEGSDEIALLSHKFSEMAGIVRQHHD